MGSRAEKSVAVKLELWFFWGEMRRVGVEVKIAERGGKRKGGKGHKGKKEGERGEEHTPVDKRGTWKRDKISLFVLPRDRLDATLRFRLEGPPLVGSLISSLSLAPSKRSPGKYNDGGPGSRCGWHKKKEK